MGDEKNRESKDRMGRLPFYPGYRCQVESRIEGQLPFYPGYRCQAESRIEGRLPFYLVKKAALEGRLPFYPGKKAKPGISRKMKFFIPEQRAGLQQCSASSHFLMRLIIFL